MNLLQNRNFCSTSFFLPIQFVPLPLFSPIVVAICSWFIVQERRSKMANICYMENNRFERKFNSKTNTNPFHKNRSPSNFLYKSTAPTWAHFGWLPRKNEETSAAYKSNTYDINVEPFVQNTTFAFNNLLFHLLLNEPFLNLHKPGQQTIPKSRLHNIV